MHFRVSGFIFYGHLRIYLLYSLDSPSKYYPMHCRVSGFILYCYHRIHLEWLQRIHLEWLHFNGFVFNKLTLYDYRLQPYKKHLHFAKASRKLKNQRSTRWIGVYFWSRYYLRSIHVDGFYGQRKQQVSRTLHQRVTWTTRRKLLSSEDAEDLKENIFRRQF